MLDNQILSYKDNIHLCPVKSIVNGQGLLFIDSSRPRLSYFLVTPAMMPAYNSFIQDIKEYYPKHSRSNLDDGYFFPVRIKNSKKEDYLINASGDKISIVTKGKDHFTKISK